jgi:hypothetical protein
MESIEGYADRLERLELEVRIAKRWRNLLLVTLGMLVVASLRSPVPASVRAKEIQAENFVLVDQDGNEAGTWGADPTGMVGAKSLVMYANGPWFTHEKAIVLRAVDGGGEIRVDGDAQHGEIMLTTDDRKAKLALFSSCQDPSHRDGITKTALAVLDANPKTGSIQVNELRHVKISGVDGDSTTALLQVPYVRK